MGVPSPGPSALKFITIALYAIVLFGLLVNVGKGIMTWRETGDYKPFVDSTLGQILYWDQQINVGVEYLKDDEMISQLPESFQKDFKNFVIKQIVFYIMLFAIISYLLYKAGNWMAGRSSFDPTTDLIIVAIIFLLVFPMEEMGYGLLMYKELVVPYEGVAQLFKPDTWDAMLSDIDMTPSNPYEGYLEKFENTTSTVNSSSGYYIDLT